MRKRADEVLWLSRLPATDLSVIEDLSDFPDGIKVNPSIDPLVLGIGGSTVDSS